MTDKAKCVEKPSFNKDIKQIFYLFYEQMMWRFDLRKYEDVKVNYDQILSRISDPDAPMPPAPYPPVSPEDICTFKNWKETGFQP